ncbi:hypothetical protein L5515_014411 [Caenorhabditis briggsae]|uniref:Uncharacterized protein n=1 Tax=Caenorhabditis briggsae TaxID=6238 RepID=A0AAE9E917_CAEBR|nr:hypothetical protein L3Y34_018284 [Caenorhabditis briggsae]UMM18266.1 hypothetical protein L5515_014411 [Caenorhabditis briggsae]
MRLLFLNFWMPILSYCWEECIFTKCKPFWNNKCTPPDDLEKHGGHTEVCEGYYGFDTFAAKNGSIKSIHLATWLLQEHLRSQIAY